MKNTIRVTIPFSFKGVEHSPSSIIDLDLFIQGSQTIDNTISLVANENKIDNFSYEYEVLESSVKLFSDPTGLAADYLIDNHFDLEGFKKHSTQSDVLQKLQIIASDTLNIDDLNGSDDIKEALLKAYQAGVNAGIAKP